MPSPKLLYVAEIVAEAKRRKLALLTAEDEQADGRTVTLGGRSYVNFGSCSYLGLEVDPRLKDGACDAIRRFGVQFASSRAYVSSPLYAELEDLLARALGAPPVIAQTTSLAHFSALPVLIGEGDLVLVDRAVHSSVRAVLPTLRAGGARFRMVAHNDMERLEAQVAALASRPGRVWYLADGVYSMSGALAPVEALRALLERHPHLCVYLDDAHGMSWTGLHGRGLALGAGPLHPRMVVVLSLAKAFAASGAALVFADPEWAALVRACGSTMIFSGPLQPALLGAGIASARVHLSDELTERQRRLVERIALFNALAAERGLPLASPAPTPLRFVEVGSEEVAFDTAERLMRCGYFTNVAVYPAVAEGKAGIRVALTLHHTLADIRGLVASLAAP